MYRIKRKTDKTWNGHCQRFVAYTRNFIKAKNKSDKQWRSKAKCRPRPTIKVPPFPPLNFVYKNLKWKKVMFRAYSMV